MIEIGVTVIHFAQRWLVDAIEGAITLAATFFFVATLWAVL